ncbi:MAG: hypothetical protein ACTS2F_18685 [Thainema sp.]
MSYLHLYRKQSSILATTHAIGQIAEATIKSSQERQQDSGVVLSLRKTSNSKTAVAKDPEQYTISNMVRTGDFAD